MNTYVTGFTYNDNNTFTIFDNDGGVFPATINQMSGLTINGTLIVDTISASTYTGLTLNSLGDVTTNIPTTPDATYQGELLYFDTVSNQWISGEEYGNLGDVTIWGKKGSAGTIDKGCPVYIVGFDSDLHEVELANATTATTMPVIGLIAEDFDDAGIYPIVTFGKISGVDTTSGSTILNPFSETWEVNDVLYMAKSDGGLTKNRPSGSDTQIQRVAKILNVGTTDGQIFVFNTARTAGLPNLTTDYLWVGNGNDTPQELIKTGVGITTTGFTYNGNNTLTITDDNGGTLSTTINQMSGLTINGTLSATTLDGNTILSGGTNLITIIESLDTNTFVSGGTYNDTTNNINFSGNSVETTFDVDLTDLVSSVSGDTFVVGGTYVDSTNTIALLRNDGNFVNVTGVTNTYVTGGTVSVSATDNSNGGTIGLLYKDSDGIPRTLPFEDTYTSGTTFASNQTTLTRNDGTEIFKLSGGTNVTLSNPSTNQIKLDVTIPAGMNTYITGFTYDDANTLTISDNVGDTFPVTINTMTGLTVNGKVITTQLQVTTSPTNGYVLTSDASGNATWQAAGGGTTLRNVGTTSTFATDNETINCTGNTFTVNLPTAVGIQGTTYTLVNSGTGVITLDANGTETINGSTTIDLSTQYISRTVQSDNTNWIVI